MRLYNISTIKIFASGSGNADKIRMEDAYEALPIEEKIGLNFLPMVHEKKTNNPKDNIIDAFFITKLLQTELKIREGILTLRELEDNVRKCFIRVTKAYPINLPVRPFLFKGE